MNKRHSLIAALLLIAMVLSLAACGSAPLNDEAFIKNMQKGLEARWKVSDNAPDTYKSNSEKKDHFKKCVNAELTALGDITAYTFENPELQALAKQYMQALQSQMDGIQYIGGDDSKYTELYTTEGYYNRARVISRLVDEFGLTVSASNQDHLDEFVIAGRARLELDKQLVAMESIISGEIVLESLGGTNYECVLTNDSEYDLSQTYVEFNLYNDKNVIVDTATSCLNSWTAGSTVQCSLYIGKEFTRAEARLKYYSNSNYDYLVTSYFPVEYVNNMQIEITLVTSLPTQIDYTMSKSVTTSCDVNDFHFEIGYWNDGKASVNLLLSGTKTYDEKGDTYSRGVRIGWKLYDENGAVVDSGTIISSDIMVGESFLDATGYVQKLAPGSYTLEILNVA